MKPTLLLLLCLLAQPLSGESTLSFGLGLELEAGYHRDVVFQQEGSSNRYTIAQSGDLTFEGFDYRPTVAATWAPLEALRVGLRVSQGLGAKRNNFMAWGPVPIPLPRANATCQFRVAPGLLLGLEFPYNPAISLQFLEAHYLAVGTDNFPDSLAKTDPRISLSYLFCWGAE